MQKQKACLSVVASLFLATNLYSQTEQIPQITVYGATKSEQSIKDVISNVEVITKEEIEERNFTTVTEALDTISGLSFTSNGGIGSSTSLFLRGMSSNRILVLVDGVNYKDPSSTSGALIQNLMISDIEKIEVIKGAQSGIWGADAAAGVINIITKKAKKGINSSINLEYGSYDTKKLNTFVSYGAEKYDVKLGVNLLKSTGFTNRIPDKHDDKNKYENDAYRNTTIDFATNYYFTDKSKIYFSLKDINSLSEYDSSNNPNNRELKSDSHTKLYNLAYFQKIKNHELSLSYELSKFKREELGTTSATSVLNFEGKKHNLEFKDTIFYRTKDFLTFGFGKTKDEVNYKQVNDNKDSKESKSNFIYMTNTNHIENLVFSQSFRYDKYDNFDNKLTGKVGLQYIFTNDFLIKTNYGTAYNVPNIMQELNPWGGGNDDVQPEKTKSFDIGFEYKDLSVTYFNSKVDNLIDWYDPDGYGGVDGVYTNVEGESRFKGFEIEYSKLLLKDTFVNFSYTHQSAKDSKGKDLTKRAKKLYKLSIDYYGLDKIHLNVNGQYIGDRVINDWTDGRVQTGKYAVVNSVVNYSLSKNTKVYVKLDNIFDRDYYSTYGYATAGRSAYLGLKYNF
ncbi:TonB-dependent receptor plug domain-containing protein [Halarcobacter bivalviorum]|uniref:TonB-dependent receptor plug domain-containing protein n=1 Tax=Halarcobacter bivalviorum TaxID=663364 RepID=UPI00100C2444|nr:TonB-dependent receptor [Halarcobacter bivalviorum]RXK07882.1 TonB-dependent receptor [Halarcobacter bivalviorum]